MQSLRSAAWIVSVHISRSSITILPCRMIKCTGIIEVQEVEFFADASAVPSGGPMRQARQRTAEARDL